jgi:hypothetical protein
MRIAHAPSENARGDVILDPRFLVYMRYAEEELLQSVSNFVSKLSWQDGTPEFRVGIGRNITPSRHNCDTLTLQSKSGAFSHGPKFASTDTETHPIRDMGIVPLTNMGTRCAVGLTS